MHAWWLCGAGTAAAVTAYTKKGMGVCETSDNKKPPNRYKTYVAAGVCKVAPGRRPRRRRRHAMHTPNPAFWRRCSRWHGGAQVTRNHDSAASAPYTWVAAPAHLPGRCLLTLTMLCRPAALPRGFVQDACSAVDACQAHAHFVEGTQLCFLYGALLTGSSAGVPAGFKYYAGTATTGNEAPTKASLATASDYEDACDNGDDSHGWLDNLECHKEATCWVKDAPQGERGRGEVVDFHANRFPPQFVL